MKSLGFRGRAEPQAETNVIAIVLMTSRSESYVRGNKSVVIQETSINSCCPQVEGGEETISDHNRNKAFTSLFQN